MNFTFGSQSYFNNESDHFNRIRNYKGYSILNRRVRANYSKISIDATVTFRSGSELTLQKWSYQGKELLAGMGVFLSKVLFSCLSYYSQTCSNNHLYKTRLRRPMLCPPGQIPMQSLLYKTTTCLTRPATSFFVSQMKKKSLPKTTTKFYPANKWEAKIRQQCIKINVSLIIFTLLLLLLLYT